jgi:hypothetical protein
MPSSIKRRVSNDYSKDVNVDAGDEEIWNIEGFLTLIGKGENCGAPSFQTMPQGTPNKIHL